MSFRKILSCAVILFLLFPFIFLFSEFSNIKALDWDEVFWAFKNSFYQAFLSAFCSMIAGVWMALGLCSLQKNSFNKVRSLFYVLCLLPNFLPPVFILLSVLNGVAFFPMGLLGVVFIHTLINSGLVAVMLAGVFEEKLSGFDELAYVEGASRWMLFRRAFFPTIRKDLAFVGLFVFTVCFSSFSIPLIVGGGKGTTVEVLIYEKMRLSSDWSSAVQLAALQSVVMFALAALLSQSKMSLAARPTPLRLLKTRSGLVPILLTGALLIYGYLQGLFSVRPGGLQTLIQYGDWGRVVLGSLFISLAAGAATFGMMLVIAFCWPLFWLERFLHSYVAPSTALACFGLLMFMPNEGFYPYLKIPLAFLMVNLTGFYRLGWQSQLQALKGQYEIGLVLGASPGLLFNSIVLPQVVQKAGLLAGLASVWACGDFAISRVLAHKDLTLAMATETLMSSYRLPQATLLSLTLILMSLICFCIFNGVAYVIRRKLSS